MLQKNVVVLTRITKITRVMCSKRTSLCSHVSQRSHESCAPKERRCAHTYHKDHTSHVLQKNVVVLTRITKITRVMCSKRTSLCSHASQRLHESCAPKEHRCANTYHKDCTSHMLQKNVVVLTRITKIARVMCSKRTSLCSHVSQRSHESCAPKERRCANTYHKDCTSHMLQKNVVVLTRITKITRVMCSKRTSLC